MEPNTLQDHNTQRSTPSSIPLPLGDFAPCPPAQERTSRQLFPESCCGGGFGKERLLDGRCLLLTKGFLRFKQQSPHRARGGRLQPRAPPGLAGSAWATAWASRSFRPLRLWPDPLPRACRSGYSLSSTSSQGGSWGWWWVKRSSLSLVLSRCWCLLAFGLVARIAL